MRFPKTELSKTDKAAIFIDRFQQHWIAKIIARPILIGLLPAVLVAYYTNVNFSRLANDNFPWLKEMLTGGSGVALLIVVWAYPSLLVGLGSVIAGRANKNKEQMPAQYLFTLLSCLDGVVGLKEKRFRDYAKELNSGKKAGGEETFRTITQPQTQIAELIRGICELFNSLYPESNQKLIRVVLAQLNQGKVEQIPVYYPNDEDPIASLEVLNSQSSTIMTCFRQRKIVVVPSIKKEIAKHHKKRRFNPSVPDSKEEGSIICYPVKWDKFDIPFVISIHCDHDGLFKEGETQYYEFLLKRFELRLGLEYNLALIRRETEK